MGKVNKIIFINILTSIAFILVNTLVLFFVYRIAKDQIGIELIGLWSIITAITSMGNVGTFGFSGSLVKHTAEFKAKGQEEEIAGILNSSILLLALLLLLFLLFIYVMSFVFLQYVVNYKYLDLGLNLLPISLCVFYFTSIGYLMLSVIEGLNKNWQKNSILTISSILLLLSVFLMIDDFGIYGLLYAQVIQAVSTLFLALALVFINVHKYAITKYCVDKRRIKEIMTYGMKFQLVSVLQIIADPITKFFLSRYGGLSLVGIYEMASRLVLQMRVLLSSLTANLLPKLVEANVTQSKNRVKQLFINVFRLNYDIFSIAFGMLIIFCPLIVRLWLGEIDEKLVYVIRVLSIAWFINSTMIVPYVYNLGSGNLKGNIASHILIALINIVFGFLIIIINGGPMLFIYAWSIALALGSSYLLWEYAKRNELRLAELFSIGNLGIFAITFICLVAMGVGLYLKLMHEYAIYMTVMLLYILLTFMYFKNSVSMYFAKEYFNSFFRLPWKTVI